MTPGISIVVASRNRPKLLTRCLIALSQLEYPKFEIVVVCDADSAISLREFAHVDQLKVEIADFANISMARNKGIELSAADLVAFIDDDAVPEPTWLSNLSKAFDDPLVTAAGGPVLGPNGITPSFAGSSVSSAGIDLADERPSAKPVHPKLEGTNCMFRRSRLVEVSGFDPSFRYFLDETDLLRRLSDLGDTIRFVPDGVVHHASTRPPFHIFSSPESVPAIGESIGYFVAKHGLSKDDCDAWRRVFHASFSKALNIGVIEPKAFENHQITLDAAMLRGQSASKFQDVLPETPSTDFRQFHPGQQFGDAYLYGHWSRQKALKAKAKRLVAEGNRVTLYLFGYSLAYHFVKFTENGYWLHKGGLFGKTDRSGRFFRAGRKGALVDRELMRIKSIRCPRTANNLV